jgi:hypothetical protein
MVDLAARIAMGGVHAAPFGAIGGVSGVMNSDSTGGALVGGPLGALGGAGVGFLGGALGRGHEAGTIQALKALESIAAGGAGGVVNEDFSDDTSHKVLSGMLLGGGLRAGRELGKGVGRLTGASGEGAAKSVAKEIPEGEAAKGIGAGGHLASFLTSALAMPVAGAAGMGLGRKVEQQHKERRADKDQHRRLVDMLMAKRSK